MSRKMKTIKSKLITIALLLLIIPLLVLSIVNFQQSKKSLEELGNTNLKNSVEMAVEMAESLQEEVENGNLSRLEAQEKLKVAVLGEKDNTGNRPINNRFDLGEYGYIFILNENGIAVAHPSDEDRPMWEEADIHGEMFIQQMIADGKNGGGFSYYHWEHPVNQQVEPKVAYSQAIPEWGWTVVSSTYSSDFNAPAHHILRTVIIVSVITIIIGAIITWWFANRISKPINLVTKQMEYLADGDLTIGDVEVKTNDEVGRLACSLNNMKRQLQTMITNVARASESMSSQSEELSQSSSEVKSGSEQVAVTMEELASGAESQANHASELSTAMQTFTGTMEEVNENSKAIEASSEEVLQVAEEGRQLMNDSKEQMETIHHIVHQAVERVRSLDNQSQEISKLISVIQEIAEQTNLLALNASIEAARAGEHGRGFAIVAEEVRKLAEGVAHSVTDITEIVTNIQKESCSVTSSLKEGYEEVERGTAQVEETETKFKDIHAAIRKVATNVHDMSEQLSTVVANSQEMNASIEEIASVSEEAAAGIEETSASSQQTSSSMEEVAASANELAVLAEELSNIVRSFKVK